MSGQKTLILCALILPSSSFAGEMVARAYGQATGCDPRVNQGCK